MRQINARERDLVCGGIGSDGARQRIVPFIVIEKGSDENRNPVFVRIDILPAFRPGGIPPSWLR